jgi:PKD domain
MAKYLRALTVLVGVFLVIGLAGPVPFAEADSYNTSVDFTQTTTTLATMPFSGTISTYNAYNTDITQDNAQLTALGNLHAGYYRVPLQWNNGNIISSAAGGPANISGDAWISKIKEFGGTPEIIVGGSTDDNFTPSDAANLVQHFNKPANGAANPVNVWVIGNEPDVAGLSIEQYCTLFNASADAMRAVDPSIQLAGPAWSFFNPTILADFLQCAGRNVNILDFHGYGMGEGYETNAQALAQTSSYQADVAQAYGLIRQYAPNQGIQVQVGEYNWSWTTSDGYDGWQGDDRFYQAVNTVWGASVAGNIAAAGGRGNVYADLNGALGLTFGQQDAAQHYGQSLNSPMPIYYGLEMFTGGNLFRGFGTSMVSAGTDLGNVEVYAANNGNIVMINKDPAATQTATIGLTGFSGGSAQVWQTNENAPFSPPAQVATLDVTNSISYPLPPYSVTTFVLNGDVSGGSAPPASAAPPAVIKAAASCTALTVTPGAVPGQYIFTASATAANGVTIAGYDFRFGDGSHEATTQNAVSHTYAAGSYPAYVSVDVSIDALTTQITSRACATRVQS